MRLVYYPDEVLNETAEPVKDITRETRDTADLMLELMHQARGIGLAGPQVGLLERMFVVHVPDDEPRVFINPKIVEASLETWEYEEGCLSIPRIYANVVRPEAITVEAYGADGKPVRQTAEGLLARVIQHELDHLDGTLFIEYLTPRRQARLMKNYRVPEEPLVVGEGQTTASSAANMPRQSSVGATTEPSEAAFRQAGHAGDASGTVTGQSGPNGGQTGTE